MKNIIRLIVFDIDGTLTDGTIIIDETGNEQKTINLKDIDAINELKRKEYLIAAVTGENTSITSYFENRFPWDYFYKGCKDKISAIKEIEHKANISFRNICYIGDGKYDIQPLEYVGLAVCPADAIDDVKKSADIVLENRAGCGCIWELINVIERYNTTINSPMHEYINARIYKHIRVFKNILNNDSIMSELKEVSIELLSVLEKHGGVYLFGNGGSAADAQHIATEFVSKFYKERPGINAEALTTNTSSLTAIGNDYSFDRIFLRQLEAKSKPGDMAIGISTSGKSQNVLQALKFAKDNGLSTVLMMGDFELSHIDIQIDHLIKIPSKDTPRIQEAHIFIGHCIAEYVEEKMCEDGKDVKSKNL